VSHDSARRSTPSSVSGSAVRKYFGELNEKQNEYVDDIPSSGRHLLSLINDIRPVKVEAGRMELEMTTFIAGRHR
jgi:hypothetical protein